MYIYIVLAAGAGGEGSACAYCCCYVCMHTRIMWPRLCAGDGYSSRCTTSASPCCVCMYVHMYMYMYMYMYISAYISQHTHMYMRMPDRGCVCAGGEGSAFASARWPAALQVHV